VTVHLNSLTLINGRSDAGGNGYNGNASNGGPGGNGGDGGAIYNSGALTLTNCTLSGNNAGNGGRYTLNHIWQLLQQMEGVEIPAKYGPPRAGDVRDSMADTAAAVRDLGHSPKFSIEEGLRRTLEWYRQGA